jgi:tight adherence protein B
MVVMTSANWLWVAALLGCMPPVSTQRLRLRALLRDRYAMTRGGAGVAPAGLPGLLGLLGARGMPRLLRRGPNPPAASQATRPDRLTRAIGAVTVSALLGLFGGLAINPLCGALLGVVATVSSWLLRIRTGERRVDASRSDLADGVTALAAECRAGAPLGVAFVSAAESAGTHAAAFVAAGGAISVGEDPGQVCARLIPDAHGLALACTLSYRSGSPLAAMLHGVGEDLAAERATRQSLRAALAGPRSSAVLLSMLPLVGVLMGSAMGASPLAVLIDKPYGAVALTAGVMLELAGLVWTTALAHHGWKAAA